MQRSSPPFGFAAALFERLTEDVQLNHVQLQTDENMSQVSYDPTQLERAVTNLVKNAVEAASQNRASPALVVISASSLPDEGCHIVVEDTGPGLGDDPSRVLRSIRSTKTHGSGLGLVISRKIIEAHSGRLLAGTSQNLGGARFDVILPNREAL